MGPAEPRSGLAIQAADRDAGVCLAAALGPGPDDAQSGGDRISRAASAIASWLWLRALSVGA